MQKYRIKLCIINKLKEKKNDAVFKNIFLRGLETSGINAKNKRMLMAQQWRWIFGKNSKDFKIGEKYEEIKKI